MMIKSKQRVSDYGEVFTPAWIVEAMLDLVKEETERIDSRFFEPACGNGNFLTHLLKRKLAAVEMKYGNSDFKKRHFALLAMMCIYGIEILPDNIAECRENLLNIFAEYLGLEKSDNLYRAASFVLAINLVHGDALTMKTNDDKPITFVEWGCLGKGKFQMQFDVIIGNPPYQKAGGAGGSSDSSIYHLFIEQAMKLGPHYICMITPARWLAGGRRMDKFRSEMLSSGKIKELVDYPVSKDVFPGVEVKGGIAYFLWDGLHSGMANVTTIRGKETIGPFARDLNEFDIFVRDARAISILHKVLAKKQKTMDSLVSNREPFKLESNFDGFQTKQRTGDVPLYRIASAKRRVDWIARSKIVKNPNLIDKWKVLVPKAGSDGGQKIPDIVLGKPTIAPSPSVCTGSYLVIPAPSEGAAKSIESYYTTKFFRFLISLRKITQDAFSHMYCWVPQQKWDREWTDELLYKKYNLSQNDIDYIEAVIKSMISRLPDS